MKKFMLPCLALCLLLLLTGCAFNRDMARISYSAEAEGQFFDGRKGSMYNFYTYWEGGEVIAYLALDKRYTLKSQFWHETAMSAGIWRDLLKYQPFNSSDEYRGAKIISSSAEPIGYVLSKYHWITAWFAEPDSTVITIPPPQRSGQQPDPDKWDEGKHFFPRSMFVR